MQSRILLLFALFLSTTFTSLAQNDDVGNWIMYFGMNKISEKFSIHTEIQYRNHTVAPVNIEQLLTRAGLNYHLSPTAMVTAGYGFISSFDFDSPQEEAESTEHRIWQQLILINKLDRIKFEHRYRIEQRWVNKDYKNRLRYRLMAFIPINKPQIEKGTFFVGLYDEIFMNTKSTFFDRNRLYAGVGYQFSKGINGQIGLLNQRVQSLGKYYLQFGVTINPVLYSTE